MFIIACLHDYLWKVAVHLGHFLLQLSVHIFVPSLNHLCTIFVPSLYIFVYLCTIFAPSLYNLCTIFVPSLHNLCTIFVPSLYHLCTSLYIWRRPVLGRAQGRPWTKRPHGGVWESHPTPSPPNHPLLPPKRALTVRRRSKMCKDVQRRTAIFGPGGELQPSITGHVRWKPVCS